jgi:hypothetical protein
MEVGVTNHVWSVEELFGSFADLRFGPMANRPSRQVLRWLFAGALLLAALYFANLAAFHAWSAGINPNPAWHEAWAARFLWISLALLVAALSVAWLLRKRTPAATKSN